MQSYLTFKILSAEPYMIELEVTASNGRYSGVTRIFTDQPDLLSLAESLDGFPKEITDLVSYEAGDKGGYAYLGLRFYCIDGVGHIAVHIVMKDSMISPPRPEIKSTAEFEILCVPSALEALKAALVAIAQSGIGSVTMYGE